MKLRSAAVDESDVLSMVTGVYIMAIGRSNNLCNHHVSHTDHTLARLTITAAPVLDRFRLKFE